MGVQTVSEAAAELELWYTARSKAAKGKSFSINGRSVTYQDLDLINRMIATLERRVLGGNERQHNFAVANFNHSS